MNELILFDDLAYSRLLENRKELVPLVLKQRKHDNV